MKPFTIYFPQFYQTKTNDRVWGAGFTDWHLVSNANLKNIWERRAPLKGYYNGNDIKVQTQIINEIKSNNLGGIGLYHYWFYDSVELNSFEKNILSGSLPETEWFIIWATESWSKRWIGDNKVIKHLSESPSEDEISKHCDYLSKCFESKNYLKINNKPLFVIYNISHFKNPNKIIKLYKKHLADRGHRVLLASFIKNPSDKIYSNLFEFNYLFEPRLFFGFNRKARGVKAEIISRFVKNIFGMSTHNKILKLIDYFTQNGKKYSEEEFMNYFKSATRKKFTNELNCFQNVITPGWNNAPRYGKKFTALEEIDPENFIEMIEYSTKINSEHPVLINAWNEWSEGAAIEPCYYKNSMYLDELNKIQFE